MYPRIAASGCFALFALLGSAACYEAQVPSAPIMQRESPSLLISDGALGGGNAHFFFLPPLVSNPNASGVSDPSLVPVVEVCEWNGACGQVIARFARNAPEPWAVNLNGDQYLANWNTETCLSGPCVLGATSTYRLSVSVAGVLLGYADLQAFSNGKELKNAATNDLIGFVDGRTLPIKFRIERGAIGVVPANGGSSLIAPASGGIVATESGNLVLQIPPGALSGTTETAISVHPLAPTAVPADRLGVAGSAFDFGPDGTEFAVPVTVTIAYAESAIPQARAESSLRLYQLVGSGWELVRGSRVDPIRNTVSGDLNHFSSYSIQSMRRLAGWTQDSRGMFLMYEDGTGLTSLDEPNEHGPAYWPTWSPTGDRLLYGNGGTSALHQIDPTGARLAFWQIGDHDVQRGTWDWRPDGSEVASANSDGLLVAPPRSGNRDGYDFFWRTPWTGASVGVWTARWSQNGDRIRFGSDVDGLGDIYSIGADGTGVTRHTFTPERWEYLGPWNRDRTKYLMLTGTDGTYDPASVRIDIRMVDAATGTESIIVAGVDPHLGCGDLSNSFPTWMPSGNRIMYMYDPSCSDSRYVSVDLQGANPLTILESSTLTQHFGWPFNRRLGYAANWEP